MAEDEEGGGVESGRLIEMITMGFVTSLAFDTGESSSFQLCSDSA